MNSLVAFDSETHIIQAGLLAPPGVCMSFAGSEMALVEPFNDGIKRLAKLLSGGKHVLVGANVAYDFACVLAAKPELIDIVFDKYERGEIFDIQIAAALKAVAKGHLFRDPVTMEPIGRYSLETCVRLFLGREDAKVNNAWVTRYHELEGQPISWWPAEAKQYPIDDAKNTLDVALRQLEEPDNLGPVMLGDQPHPLGITHMTREARAAWAMHLAGVWGLRTDPAAVERLERDIEEKYQASRKRFRLAGLFRADDTKDTAAVKRRVIQAYGGGAPCEKCTGTGRVPGASKRGKNCPDCGGSGLEVPAACPRTDKRGISMSRDTLAESGDELLEEFADVSNIDKIRGTYLPFLKQGAVLPITLRANVMVETDRTSYDGVIQLMPREGGIRECFVARPGYVWCSVDYSALELCTFSQVCLWVLGYSTMAEAINSAKTPGILHTILGARMIGADPEKFVALVKAGDKDAKNKRQMAKALNFGRLGGMGAPKLVLSKRKEGLRFCLAQGIAEKCGTTMITQWQDRPCPPVCADCVEVAASLIKQFDNEWWPEVKDYFQFISSYPGVSDGMAVLESPGTGFLRGGLHFTNAANHCFQHLAAAGAKHAMWLVSKECYTDKKSPLYGSRPIFLAHDEIITEMPEDRAHEAGHRQAEVMIKAMRDFVPDVHIAAEPALMRRWYKAAEPVFENGRLVPWEPK